MKYYRTNNEVIRKLLIDLAEKANIPCKNITAATWFFVERSKYYLFGDLPQPEDELITLEQMIELLTAPPEPITIKEGNVEAKIYDNGNVVITDYKADQVTVSDTLLDKIIATRK